MTPSHTEPAVEFEAVVKSDCPTCQLIWPALQQLIDAGCSLSIYYQDTAEFPPIGVPLKDDTSLAHSWVRDIETVPTLLRIEEGEETDRRVGWVKQEWQDISGVADLAESLPAYQPGCGSRTREPGMPARLRARYAGDSLYARSIHTPAGIDPIEYCYDQGWSDGLPLVPPTPERVMAMLEGTDRDPGEQLGDVPPDLATVNIEKVAINAVMAGCKAEYLPVVIAAVQAVLSDEFCMHGLLATTYFSGPMVIVSGSRGRLIGMNSGVNALGQGNRANATIGRALQLVIRNIGGGRPGGIDRAALGNPGKYTFCFAEAEDADWTSLREEQGFRKAASCVTVFAGDGVQGVVDQKSRDPESLCRSFAASLVVVGHAKMVMAADAFLVITPEHARVFHAAGWSKQRVLERLAELLMRPGEELISGALGMAEGIPSKYRNELLPKFREGGLNIVRAGGSAGMFSAIIAGWGASGNLGSSPVTVEIGT